MEPDSDDVPIIYSNEKLKKLLDETDLPVEEIFYNYVKSLKYEHIKDFPLGTAWFNTTEPLSFKKHLKGKLVLLDFFTYCCINCMHVLPDLKDIENSFSIEDGLVVIGVHSAKFENEKEAENVKSAVLRYGIEHPVMNDAGAKMWKQCDIHCWPSLLLVSPEGQPLVILMGEGQRDTLKLYIKQFLVCYSAQISKHSLPITKSADVIQHEEPLLFPGKIKACNDRLCISDSGNNRLIIVDHFEQVEKQVLIIGSQCGESGFHDGVFTDAMFNQPQGVVFLSKDILFVADTGNHAIRRIDIKSRLVSTVAGNGSQSNDKHGGRIGTQQGISSPWDLEIFRVDEVTPVLLVAMAGTHQIWGVFLEDAKWWKGKEYAAGTVVCIAGSGREENRNNDYPMNAAFAQPSGLAVHQHTKAVFIADSESSTVRRLSLVDGKVTAVVGGDKNPNNLFAFGDRDGVAFDGKLQHCLGLATAATSRNESCRLFVADTYNHKIKIIDADVKRVTTIKSPKFNEPCGLLQTPEGRLYIADTNGHQIKICTLNEDETAIIDVSLLMLENIGVQPVPNAIDSRVGLCTLPTLRIFKQAAVQFSVSLNAMHWTDGAPNKWAARSSTGCVTINPANGKDVDKFSLGLNVDKDKRKGDDGDVVDVTFETYTCQGDLCFNKQFVVRLPVMICVQESDNVAMNAKVTISINDITGSLDEVKL